MTHLLKFILFYLLTYLSDSNTHMLFATKTAPSYSGNFMLLLTMAAYRSRGSDQSPRQTSQVCAHILYFTSHACITAHILFINHTFLNGSHTRFEVHRNNLEDQKLPTTHIPTN